MRFNLNDYVLFWPGVAVAFAIAVLASGWIGGVLRRPRAAAFGLAFSVGVVVAATLTPGREALLFGIPGSGSCDLSDFSLPTIAALRRINDTSLNVLLFVPLGFTAAFAPPSRRTLAVIVAALALSPMIEGVQLLVTRLGRSCQSVDIVNNLTGLVIGFAIAGLAVVVAMLAGARLVGAGVGPDPAADVEVRDRREPRP